MEIDEMSKMTSNDYALGLLEGFAIMGDLIEQSILENEKLNNEQIMKQVNN